MTSSGAFIAVNTPRPDDETAYLAATQFEATDARRAFPCWDEPAAKASFQVTLEIPSGMIGISNTQIEEETPTDGGSKLVRFAETPKMSTYLLAFIVGDMAAVEEKTSQRHPGAYLDYAR